jgi:saccharopine dehydrogenase-like NADP-dependent oxidoreductase
MKYLIIGSGRMTMGVVYDLLSLDSTSDVHVTDRER